MDSFFQFRAHGTTPRIVSYVLLKFGVVPSTFEASAGDGAAACDAMWKSRATTKYFSGAVNPHLRAFRATPCTASLPAIRRDLGRHAILTVLVKVIRCSHCMSAAGFTRGLKKLMKKSSVFTRKTPSMYVSPVVIYRPLRCFAFLLPPMIHHATPSSARISTRPLTRRPFLSSHPPSF